MNFRVTMSANNFVPTHSLVHAPQPPPGNNHNPHGPPPQHIFQVPATFLDKTLGITSFAPPGEGVIPQGALQPPSLSMAMNQSGTGAGHGPATSLQSSPIFNPNMSFQPPITPNIGSNGGHFQTPGSVNSGTSPTFLQSPNGPLSAPPSATQQYFYHQSVPHLPLEHHDQTQVPLYKPMANTLMSPPPLTTQASASNNSVDRQMVAQQVSNAPPGSSEVFYVPRRLNFELENRRKSMVDGPLQTQVPAIHGNKIIPQPHMMQGILDSEYLKQEIMQQPPPMTTAMTSSRFYTSPPSSPSLEHSLSITPEEVLSSFANDSGIEADTSEHNITIDDLLKDDPFAELTGADFSNSKFQIDSDGTEPEFDDDQMNSFLDDMMIHNSVKSEDKPSYTGLGLSVPYSDSHPGSGPIIVQKRSPKRSPGAMALGKELFKSPPQLQQGSFANKLSSPPRFLSTSSSNVNLVQQKQSPARVLKKAQSFTGGIPGIPVNALSSPHPHLSLKDCSNEFATNLFINGTNPGFLTKPAKKIRSLSANNPKRKSLTKLPSTSVLEKPSASRKNSLNGSPGTAEFTFPSKKGLKNMESGLLSFQLDMSSKQ